MEGDFVLCEVGGHSQDAEEEQRLLSQATAPPQKRIAVLRVESAETQDCVSAPQWIEEENEEEVEELSFVPSAVSEPRWALHMCDNKCWRRGLQVPPNLWPL